MLLPILFLAAWGPGFARHGKWKGLQQPLLRISLVLLAASAACGPWLAKNWALAGNPVYPLLASQFGGTTRTPEKIAQWEKAHKVPQD